MRTTTTTSLIRRSLMKAGASAALTGLASKGVWAAGSDKPEKEEVKVGFIALTDCASVVMASVLGFDQKYGIKIIPSKQSSWAGVRDKLVNGELDAAHMLYGLIYGVQMGVGGPSKDMAVLMNLSHNGQAITLSNKLAAKGVVDGASLAKLMRTDRREYAFAQTFPTGTHAMWLYYWLAAYGIDPMKDAKVITVPPPQVLAYMRAGKMDGFCLGEPWSDRAAVDGVGVTAVASQDGWKNHPETTLGTTREWVKKHPNTARALVAAVLDASRWIDAGLSNKIKMAETIAGKSYVNTAVDVNCMQFHNDGNVNFPYLSDGMWLLTQHKRWGLLKTDPDYLAVATGVNQVALYKEAASLAKASVPESPLRSVTMIDGTVWDGSNPKAYADSFKIKV